VLEANVAEPSDQNEIRKYISGQKNVIARGNGRCYGDSSLGENIVSTLKLNRILSFDEENGTLECESGTLLSEILDVIVPRSYFLPVTPGTKFVTLGGAIAADVHGKNHHCEGSFSNHVIHLDLLQADGEVVRCSPDANPDWFWQTCGGMGLTGVILSAKFRLKAIETSYIRQTTYKASDIERVMQLFDDSENYNYSVAWIDCFAKQRALGRSILRLGEHAEINELPAHLRRDPLRLAAKGGISVPFHFPSFSVNRLTVKTMNLVYYHRERSTPTEALQHFDKYFYPLDGIQNWNRAYGRKGFLQYQCVLPKEKSFDGLKAILEKIGRSGMGSPLAVLKLFGPPDPNAVMSFPMEGYTLALDFKVAPSVFALLNELDEIVLKNSGRIYLAKDARMSREMFHSTYSNIVRSDLFRSAQAQRLDF